MNPIDRFSEEEPYKEKTKKTKFKMRRGRARTPRIPTTTESWRAKQARLAIRRHHVLAFLILVEEV